MSWDVFIQHLPASAITVADVPDDFAPLPLGSRAYVLNVIASVFPAADASDPTWLTLQTAAYSIDFSVGADDPVSSVALHVRGDESVIPAIVSLIDTFGARAVDSWTGEFFEPSAAADSIRHWSAYVRESTS